MASSSPGQLEFNVPFQHKYGYIRDDSSSPYVVIWSEELVQLKPLQPTTYLKNLNEVLPVPSVFKCP